jgi:hypothetical protein
MATIVAVRHQRVKQRRDFFERENSVKQCNTNVIMIGMQKVTI